VDAALADLGEDVAGPGARIEVTRPLGQVRANGPVLRQVVANLAANAAKFVRPGESPRVRIRAEERDGRVRLFVEDDGIGIEPRYFERIFAPFQRLHGAESYPGTGIGLAIVRRAVERMQGTCGVESEPGSGSRFWIELAASGPNGEA
jgi:signal transduction histidine kinase